MDHRQRSVWCARLPWVRVLVPARHQNAGNAYLMQVFTFQSGRGNQTAGGVGGGFEMRQRNLMRTKLGLCVRERLAGRAND